MTTPPTLLKDCFSFSRISKVLFIGDSNARLNYYAFITMIERYGKSCTDVKLGTKSAAYYAGGKIHVKDVKIKQKGCRICQNKLKECAIKSETSPMFVILVEYLSMDLFRDSTLTTPRQCNLENKNCVRSTTTQEFLFQEYLGESYPDLIFIFRNSHEVRLLKNIESLQRVTTHAVQTVTKYVPKSTTVVWLTEIAEYDSRRPLKYRGQSFSNFKLPYEVIIPQINQIFYDALKPHLIKENTNHFGYFNVYNMSTEVLSLWNVDGVHMVSAWYDRFISYLTQTVCNSDLKHKHQ